MGSAYIYMGYNINYPIYIYALPNFIYIYNICIIYIY